MKDKLLMPDSQELKLAFPFLTIKESIGEGGQKYVYLANQNNGQSVALKVIKKHETRKRTKREIIAASYFTPPYFPQIYSWGETQVGNEEVIFFIEEYIEGSSLREYLNKNSISEQEALRIGVELLCALNEVADKRLVHRDIKPENIIIGQKGRVVLLDFGIARHLMLSSLTKDIAAFGPMTPGYAAPEQIRNEKRSISTRTDMFAWGIIMYEMISGINPFTKDCSSVGEALQRTLNYNPPTLINCNPRISNVVDWCLKKAPHRRPSHPSILIEQLKEVLI